MKKYFRQLLNNKPKLRCLWRFFVTYKDKNFRQYILNWRESPYYFEIENYGDLNADKIIYLIEFDNTKSGFYAVYHSMLELLYFCDSYNMIPVIKMPKKWLYSDGSENPFDLYFEQPGGITYEEAMLSNKVVKAGYWHKNLINSLYHTGRYYEDNEDKIIALSVMQQKYMKFKGFLNKDLLVDIKEKIGKKRVLAIHFRGTDYKKAFDGHPVYVTFDEYAQVVRSVIDTYNYKYIFLATDDSEAVTKFKEEFSDIQLIMFDSLRSEGNISVAMIKCFRENNEKMLAYEVIRDALTLSYCDSFIGNMSMVSTAAQIYKKSRNEQFEILKILDKGINHNNMYLGDFERSMN